MPQKQDLFKPDLHNASVLSDQLAALPARLTLAGSLGRCVVMGELKQLVRANGTVIDIDVIDTAGEYRLIRQMTTGAFAVDACLTNYVRPVDQESWGVYIPEITSDEPQFTLPNELCSPEIRTLPWDTETTVSVMPAAMQVELEHISGRQYKNRSHRKAFFDWVAHNKVEMPHDVAQKFEAFHEARESAERQVLSSRERLYRKARRTYIGFAPGPVQTTVENAIGPAIRKLRHTSLDQPTDIG